MILVLSLDRTNFFRTFQCAFLTFIIRKLISEKSKKIKSIHIKPSLNESMPESTGIDKKGKQK